MHAILSRDASWLVPGGRTAAVIFIGTLCKAFDVLVLSQVLEMASFSRMLGSSRSSKCVTTLAADR